MTSKQEQFCYEYISNGYHATAAYQTVYKCQKSTAKAAAYRTLKKPEVQELIAEIRRDILDEMKVDPTRVTTELASIAFDKESESTTNRLKALSVLTKTLGMEQQKVEVKTEDVIKVELTD